MKHRISIINKLLMNYSKTVVEDFSKKIEKVYINVCKTYGLEIKKECKNYFKEIIDCDETDDCCIINSYLNGVRDVYYPYLVRYIKIINARNKHLIILKFHIIILIIHHL